MALQSMCVVVVRVRVRVAGTVLSDLVLQMCTVHAG